jgi:phage host-nuclease inhibitor protein Gam
MRPWILLFFVCAAAALSALAQDQLAAIRAACAEDAQKLCAGVQPGGGRIVACLKAHKDSLSDQCKKAEKLT